MWFCTFKRCFKLIVSATTFLFAVACPMFNNGSNSLPDGYQLSGVGPFEETPFEVCDDISLVSASFQAIAVPKNFTPIQCSENADCEDRTYCSCGVCLPKPCTTVFDCGLGNCVNGHCLKICNPQQSNNQCPKGYFCSAKDAVCKPFCQSDEDCAPGEVCTDDGDTQKVCAVKQLGKHESPPEGLKKMVIKNGIKPECPSVVNTNNGLTLFFVVRKNNQTLLYRADAPKVQNLFNTLRFKITANNPIYRFDWQNTCPDITKIGDNIYLFFDNNDGVYGVRLSEDFQITEAPTKILDGNLRSPDVLETDQGALMVVRADDKILFAITQSKDDVLSNWQVKDAVFIDKQSAESTNLPEFAPCLTDSHCQKNLYCAITDKQSIGLCLPKDCQKCKAPAVCQDNTCVCQEINTCAPQPYPVWLNITKLESATLLNNSESVVVFFSAKGRTTVANSQDFSIGAAILNNETISFLTTNPVFDRMVLTLHKDEFEPEVFATANAVFIVYSDSRTLRAARCPQKDLVKF